MSQANERTGADNEAIVRRFFEEVSNQRRPEVLQEIIAPNYVDYGHSPPGRGPQGRSTTTAA